MIVSATGDPSNVDNFTAGEVVEDWRLVPNDNNVALRNVKFPPRLAVVIPDSGEFGNVCLRGFKDLVLILSNSGYSVLTVSNIISPSAEFLVPSVLSYPLTIEAGTSLQISIRFQPVSFGSKSATITVISNDPGGPKIVEVSGTANPPRLAVVIADEGDFGKACVGAFVNEMLSLNNSGHCKLTITGIASSSAEFLAPNVLFYPLTIEAGGSLQVPIRFSTDQFRFQISDDHCRQRRPDRREEYCHFRECAFRKARRHRFHMHRRCEGMLSRRAHDLDLQRGRLQTTRDERCLQTQEQALEVDQQPISCDFTPWFVPKRLDSVHSHRKMSKML